MRDFKEYEIWQLSHEFTLEIYELTKSFPNNEIYGLTSQIRRACSSIPTNISEGCGRDSDSEFNRFLTIALGSANETEYLIIPSNDLNYITKEKSTSLIERINIIKRKTYQLKQKLTA
ncbi:MAG: four helix bundle protein [Lutibacter sp.]|jgi:four helix bundle protein